MGWNIKIKSLAYPGKEEATFIKLFVETLIEKPNKYLKGIQ